MRLGVRPVTEIRIVCVESKYTLTCIRKDDRIKININHDGASLGSITFEELGSGMATLARNHTGLNEEDRQACLTVYMSAMAFMVFGNDTADPEDAIKEMQARKQHESKKTSNRKKSESVTYIINRSGKVPTMRIQGHHASPQGQFSVRGHYRHYKNGKVVWLAEYEKGKGEKKSKLYKIKPRKDEKND